MSSSPFGTPSKPALRPEAPEPHLLLSVRNVGKSYTLAGRRQLRLFENLNLFVPRGQILAVVGQSGVGKSTLLHLLGALDRPTSGSICCAGTELTTLSSPAAARFRNREVGYVWQFHYLLPEFTAQENVAMPLLARGVKAKAAGALAGDWLARVGLGDRATHRAGELSGGEQQRVSLARALITGPKLLLADEPTGDLDEVTAETIFALLEQLHREAGLTTVLVTHNMALAGRCHRVVRLTHDGMNEEPGPPEPANVQ